jgi:cytochrome c-type biogenesis protein CcmH
MVRLGLLLGLLIAPVAVAEPAGSEAGTETSEEVGQLPFPPLEDAPEAPVAAARIKRLSAALRCPVCQGMSVAASPSDAARAMADRIAELVHLGYTEDQITEYFVDRYGPWVELEPPNEGIHRVLFWGPVSLLGVGILGLAAWSRRRRETGPVASTAPQKPDPDLDPWRKRILAELDEGAP